jgi:hypothetical protein
MNDIMEQLKANVNLRDKRSTIALAQRKLDELNAKAIECAYEDNAISKIKTSLITLIDALENDTLPDDKTSVYDIKSQLFRI